MLDIRPTHSFCKGRERDEAFLFFLPLDALEY